MMFLAHPPTKKLRLAQFLILLLRSDLKALKAPRVRKELRVLLDRKVLRVLRERKVRKVL
jgi:hypothetical protein